ncbi:hypothetical protein V9L05_09865 [Bernardetia sp. Wsw4-3y2]|uniref:hypothetical protein n=1 Tax=Bernardetia sp. Wsw4-3y2 TaxID=3127471 RepID=UPI0030CAC0C8
MYTAKKSPFRLKKFVVTHLEVGFISKTEKSNQKSSLKIDFDILQAEQNTNIFKILFHLSYNEEKEQGIFYEIETTTTFRFTQRNLEENYISGSLYYSGLPMSISFIRAYLAQITSSFPSGKHLLESIDLHDLIQSKQTHNVEN